MIFDNESFRADWASPPGNTIGDLLEEKSIEPSEFRRQIGLSSQKYRALIEGKSPISIGTARQLSKVLGSSVEFWIERDLRFQQKSKSLWEENDGFLSKLPIDEMMQFGWIDSTPSAAEQFTNCLDFFGVENATQWSRTYERNRQDVAFRRSPSFRSRPGPISAWLRQGEIIGNQMDCAPWSSQALNHQLDAIRSLCRFKEPAKFLDKLQDYCAMAGVAIAIVRAPTGCGVSGLVRFLNPEKALIQLSFRYLSDDHFWFTVFHEIGHLLLHKPKGIVLEEEDQKVTNEEREANEFSANVLIPKAHRDELMNLKLHPKNVVRFAVRLGISPGVVVGQLQHYRRLKYSQMNQLKRRYEWQ